MAKNRRIIYMEDETWERLRDLADEQKTSISAVIRDAVAPPVERKPVASPVVARDKMHRQHEILAKLAKQ